jgi:hypothetical protein
MNTDDEEPLLSWAEKQPPPTIRFNGPAYEPKHDQERLTGQINRIFTLMRDSKWRTLGEIAKITGDPEASVSAQLRHLRKPRFGGHTIERQRRGEAKSGLPEYKLTVKTKDAS